MAEETISDKKKPMTDAERLELAQKLDQELDDFINSLEKKRYTEGWPEDRWEEEMDKHPFFMKSNPDGDALSPLAEGLAKLKYDPGENTSLELATNYKEDGNFNFKHKNYRLAILGYTEGIKVKSDNADINASLYNNRAASHYHLKNYRSALLDSEKALKYCPDHVKARIRAAKSAYNIAKYDSCIEHCQRLLEIQPNEKEITELLNTAKKKKMVKERDERKMNRINSKKAEEKEMIVKAVIERGIKILNCEDEDDIATSNLKPYLPGENCTVHFDDGILIWPVLFLYPEYKITDIVETCPENVPLLSHMEQLFPAPWDQNNEYKCSTVNVYFEGADTMPHLIDPSKNLGDLLVSKNFVLKEGTPAFCVLPRGSVAERRFLETYV